MKEYLIRSLELTFNGKPWYGHGIMEKLDVIVPETAYIRPEGCHRCIAEIVNHMIAWRQYALEHFNQNKDFAIQIDSIDDWPATQKEWPAILDALRTSQQSLVAKLTECDEEWLNQPSVEPGFTYGQLLEGIIHHDIYHLGQIGLVASMLNAANNEE